MNVSEKQSPELPRPLIVLLVLTLAAALFLIRHDRHTLKGRVIGYCGGHVYWISLPDDGGETFVKVSDRTTFSDASGESLSMQSAEELLQNHLTGDAVFTVGDREYDGGLSPYLVKRAKLS